MLGDKRMLKRLIWVGSILIGAVLLLSGTVATLAAELPVAVPRTDDMNAQAALLARSSVNELLAQAVNDSLMQALELHINHHDAGSALACLGNVVDHASRAQRAYLGLQAAAQAAKDWGLAPAS